MKSEAFVSIVLVVKNQTSKLIHKLDELAPYLDSRFSDYEMVIIDQRSDDNIQKKLLHSQKKYQSIRYLLLSREVSNDVALAAGLENSIGDIVINLNLDHDKINLIDSLVQKSLAGNDIIVCISKRVNSFFYKKFKFIFNWLLLSIGYTLPHNSTGTFCLNRRAVNALTDSGRFFCKLHMRMNNIGFDLCDFDSDEYLINPKKKRISSGINDAIHHMVFNSTKPLRWMSFLGIGGSFLAVIFSIYSVILHLIRDDIVPGWTTTILFVSFLFLILFVMFSFFGEYLARLLNDRSEHKEYTIAYEQNSSVMFNENRFNVITSDDV
jgi:hypothetical protein